MSINLDNAMQMLHRWARFAERDWLQLDDTGIGCYGSGFNYWGVQTNQKYLAAMAALAVKGENVPDLDRQWALDRALGALRYSLRTHHTGDLDRTDGSRWGRTWISTLGTERMMHGVILLQPHLANDDRRRLREMMCDEADWQCYHHERGGKKGPLGNVWGNSGANNPESNIWVGAHLWRTAQTYPDHPHASDWQELAHRYLINGVSVEGDATDQTIVAGKPVAERHVGPNFFPNYALDHHGYLNVGYMTICASNAAMLHFDMKLAGLQRPESLDHHQADLWAVLRRLLFSNGRLARIGGDTRLRYTYCQEYLLPSLLYAADRHADAHALGLVEGQLQLMHREMEYCGDGSFYSRRLGHINQFNPYYYTRVESDRACVLGMLAAYLPHVKPQQQDAGTFEESVSGSWSEPEHGAVMHRGPERLASFAWRAFRLCQGMCLPPSRPHMAEWEHNLAGYVRFADEANDGKPSRHPGDYMVKTFDGGFLTWGAIIEGTDIRLNEGWSGTDSAEHHLAVAALPDGHTMLAVQLCRIGPHRRYLAEVKGLHLNSSSGVLKLQRPLSSDELLDLGGRWACIDGCIGVVGLYGADALTLVRPAGPVGGPHGSLNVEEVCFPYRKETASVMPGEIVLDVGWAAISNVGDAQTKSVSENRASGAIETDDESLRAASVAGQDGNVYIMVMNVGAEDAGLPVKMLQIGGCSVEDVVTGEQLTTDGRLAVAASSSRLLRCKVRKTKK